jgi:hypothetical protein
VTIGEELKEDAMSDLKIIPPGEHPYDPIKKDIDPVGFALERLQTYLTWIDEHRASFEKMRASNPTEAERELEYLADSTREALRYFLRLSELLLGGHGFDPNKRLPRGLFAPQWKERLERFLNESKNEVDKVTG